MINRINIIILLCILIFVNESLAGGISNSLGVNQLNNSGFESVLNSWTSLYGFPTQVSGIHNSGNFSAKKTIGNLLNQDYYSTIYQDVYYNSSHAVFPTNTTIYVSGYVKTNMNPITKSKAGIQVQFLDANDQVLNIIDDKVGGQTDWRHIYIRQNTPTGTVKVRVLGYDYARRLESVLGGDSYFDDFIFSRTPISLPSRRTNLINGGFENGLNDWNEAYHASEITTAIKHSGNMAVVHELGTNHYGVVNQKIDVNPYESHRFEAWVATNININTPSTVSIYVKYLNASGQQIGQTINQPIGSGNNNWTRLEINAIAPVGARKAEFGLMIFSSVSNIGDRVYFDDAYIQNN